MNRPHLSTTAGWREWVALTNAGVPWVKAKLDTGARSSALHAFDVEEYAVDGAVWVRFGIRPWQDSEEDARIVELPVHDRRIIRSSSGHTMERIVVLLDITLLGRNITAGGSLSNRDEMGFRMLIGREALRQGFLVDSSVSFLGGRAPRRVRRTNRGKTQHTDLERV